MTTADTYRNEIAQRLSVNSEHISLYWKGRVALYAILKAMGISKGDEVIIPAFTCVVVPNAILYLGATPVYVDIEKDTLNTNLSKIKRAVTNHTKCIIVQNTFGLSSEVDEIVSFAKEQGITTIEDCTHGFGGTFKGKPNGSYCDAAFYSTQWNKPFSTGIGGFSVIHREELLAEVKKVNLSLIKPTLRQRKVLSSLVKFRKYLLNDSTYWSLIKMYRALSKYGLVVGSSTDKELTSIEIPSGYFMASCAEQQRAGISSIQHLNADLALRRANGLAYTKFLRTHGKWNYPDDVLENHSFLKYPVFVKDRDAFLELAEKAKIRLGDWFLSPIHPVLANFDLWELNCEEFPVASAKSAHILNLPTDVKDNKKVIQFLEDHINQLM